MHINGLLTAEKYFEVLDEVMLPTIRAVALPEDQMIFMNATISVNKSSAFCCEDQLFTQTCYTNAR